MLDTQSLGLFVRQNWMPLDGAFSFLSGALAYALARTVCSAWQRYDIIFILGLFFRINFVFPHLFLLSLLQMHHCGHLVADAHVRTAVVIEMDESFNNTIGVLKGVETLPIDTFHLYFPIDRLCDGVVRWLVVLGHGDADVISL